MDIIAEIQSTIAATTGLLSNAQGAMADAEGAIAVEEGSINIANSIQIIAQNTVRALQAFNFAVKASIMAVSISILGTWIMNMILKVPDIVKWSGIVFKCGITKIFNLPYCFFWYFIEMLCWVIYLPFRFIFWLVDGLLGTCIVKQEHELWCYLDDLDKLIYESYGFHLIHYQDEVMNKCYTCQIPRFPVLPEFPQHAIRKIQGLFSPSNPFSSPPSA